MVLNNDQYGVAIDLSTIDYPYWDQFLWDIEHTWSDMYGKSGPRCIDPFLGYVMTWQYHQDLLDKAGLDPAKTVKSWEDLKMWLDEGSKWAKSADSPVDRFWDQGWLDPGSAGIWSTTRCRWPSPKASAPTRSPAGRARRSSTATTRPTASTWSSSPRPTRRAGCRRASGPAQWEADMESSFAAKKSAVMCHGPWTFDKTMSIDPTAQMGAFPATPPAEGQDQWMQLQSDPGIDTGSMAFFMRTGNEKKPKCETIKDFYIWWNSPDTVRLRAEALGFMPGMKLDPPAELKGGQWDAVTSQIEVKGGKYENSSGNARSPAKPRWALSARAAAPAPGTRNRATSPRTGLT